MRSFILYHAKHLQLFEASIAPVKNNLPKRLIRYWHDPQNVPVDVISCMASWDCLKNQGFEIIDFDDCSAALYIKRRYSELHANAFSKCRHPAMRSDYLRLCYILADGGFYVDVDDVLLGDNWKSICKSQSLKLQPLCYDIPSGEMIPAKQLNQSDFRTDDRIFYVNNNPIVAPSGHPVLQRALERATDRLLKNGTHPEIQETTGPGNITSALAAYLRDTIVFGNDPDFELIFDWDEIAETRWELSYRNDSRNWRNMDQERSY